MPEEQFQKNKIGWEKSVSEGFSQDENGDAVPWMTYPAIEFLKKNLTKNHRIFEFGCGASTLFFASRVKKVVGLETRPNWVEMMLKRSNGKLSQNVEITLMEDGLTNNSYENFANNCGQKFNFIVVDSLKRFECARNSVDALDRGGAIILDDSERPHYKKIFDFFSEKNFKKQDFPGISPGQMRVKNTTIFFN